MQIHPVLGGALRQSFDSKEDTGISRDIPRRRQVSTLIRWLNSSDPGAAGGDGAQSQQAHHGG